jgi:hypothetical protein
MTSFVSLLLPVMFVSRRRMNLAEPDADGMDALRVHPTIGRVLEAVMGVERLLIRSGVSFPAGGSLLLVARKPGTSEAAA